MTDAKNSDSPSHLMPPSELSYKQAMDELDAIVSELDDGSVDVDTLGVRFQRALDIVENLDSRILKTKEQIDRLAPRLDQLNTRQES